MKKRLGILEEVAYSYKLMQRLNKSEKSSFSVYSFSEKESIEKFLQDDSLDLLLVGEDYYDSSLNSYNIGQVIILQEEIADCDKENSIYKYQGASDILRQLNSMLNLTAKSVYEDMPVKIFGIYSPLGRCGKTSFAKVLAKKLAEKRNVLYLNLKPFADIEGGILEDALSLSDVFYLLEQGRSEKEILDKAVIERDGLKFIRPMDSLIDLQEISEAAWNDFFMKLNNGRVADVIIVVFNECISCFLQLFELCEKVYMPVLEEDVSLRKIKCFEDFLQRSVSKEAEEKICRLNIPVLGTEKLPMFQQCINRLVKEINVDG